ncbi:two-component system, response regulator [Caballeronia temeraria]|uniref:Two-component system, response regulator n=1 Tax=Caballeronia temeraria TaxID=1777137 RepID=A0A157ZW90_9BURK|nr:response regulator [Caballeronia temeraria]SAK49770.1 two-component system, response regulator [Caballeronia temeraria]
MKPECKISIVVADNRPVVLSGLQSWFESHERLRVAACVTAVDQLLPTLNAANYDVIVLSCAIAGSHAGCLSLLRELRRTFPDTPVVALTDEIDAHALADIQRAGAAGLVSMRENVREFERVYERALSGATQIVSPRIAAYCDPAGATVSFDTAPNYHGVRVSVREFVARG